LYFGCREKDSDFIYREEMANALDNKVISELHICLSREKDQPRTYVQNSIAKNQAKVKEILIEKKGNFYICGSTSMGKEVNKVLEDIVGADELANLKKTGKLIQELW
jgi:sulfite reductase alpha subunit-like flavoprotein